MLDLKHELKLDKTRDEKARMNFVSGLRAHVLNDMASGMRAVWDAEVEPAFRRSLAAVDGRRHMRVRSRLLGAVALSVLLVTSPLLLAQADRDWKREPWYSPDLYPDAPFLREGGFGQQPLQGKLLRVKRPLVVVSDLERSLRFYVDVLGLELYSVDPYYDKNPDSLGYAMFGVPQGSRKRMAMLNTSDEIRGLTLQEIRDVPMNFSARPRSFTILFETDDLLGIRERAQRAGMEIIEPQLGDIPATSTTPALRFIEFAVMDPDDHVISFFQSFESDEEWRNAQRILQTK